MLLSYSLFFRSNSRDPSVRQKDVVLVTMTGASLEACHIVEWICDIGILPELSGSGDRRSGPFPQYGGIFTYQVVLPEWRQPHQTTKSGDCLSRGFPASLSLVRLDPFMCIPSSYSNETSQHPLGTPSPDR